MNLFLHLKFVCFHFSVILSLTDSWLLPLRKRGKTAISTTSRIPDSISDSSPYTSFSAAPSFRLHQFSASIMSDQGSPVDDGHENEFQDEVADADSDRESDVLSEIDENQFEDYDPETANIEDRPVEIDEDIARTLKATKRKRAEGEPAAKKPRETRREKRKDREDDASMQDVSSGEAEKKPRRKRAEAERRPRAKPTSPQAGGANDENLTQEQRQNREIDRRLDAALKTRGAAPKRRKKDEIVRL